jgi:hypothetical protein
VTIANFKKVVNLQRYVEGTQHWFFDGILGASKKENLKWEEEQQKAFETTKR